MSRTLYFEEITILKWILFGGYCLIFIIGIIQCVRWRLRFMKKKSSKSKWIYMLVIFFAITRIVLFAIPTRFYAYKIQTHSMLQFCLDILPELEEFSIYLLLLTMWIQLYCFAKYRLSDALPISRKLWSLYILINLAVYGTAIGIGYHYRHYTYSHMHLTIEAIFLVVISSCMAVVYLGYAIALLRVLNTTLVRISSERKQQIVRKLQRILIVCLACFWIHASYILFINVYLRTRLELDTTAEAFIWFFYFVLTEQLPIALILYFVRAIPDGTSQSQNSSSRGLLNGDESSRSTII